MKYHNANKIQASVSHFDILKISHQDFPLLVTLVERSNEHNYSVYKAKL